MKKGDKKRKQKALARRTKRKARTRAVQAAALSHLALSAIRLARSYPLLGCWTAKDWDKHGLAIVIVACRQPDGNVVFGSFEVDYYCLGVKDAYCNAGVPYDQFLNEFVPRAVVTGPPLEIGPNMAHELIYGSIEYAACWGFRPHPDYKLAQSVLDLPEQHPRTGKVTFGLNGKPLFISGPYDNAQTIVCQLERTAGQGNFDFVVGLGTTPFDDVFDA
jgi:hypothetical protein